MFKSLFLRVGGGPPDMEVGFNDLLLKAWICPLSSERKQMPLLNLDSWIRWSPRCDELDFLLPVWFLCSRVPDVDLGKAILEHL